MEDDNMLKREMRACGLTIHSADRYVKSIVDYIMSPDIRNQILGFELIESTFPRDYSTLLVFRKRILVEWLKRPMTYGCVWKRIYVTDDFYTLILSEDVKSFIFMKMHKLLRLRVDKVRLLESDDYIDLVDNVVIVLPTEDKDIVLKYKRFYMLKYFDKVYVDYLKKKLHERSGV